REDRARLVGVGLLPPRQGAQPEPPDHEARSPHAPGPHAGNTTVCRMKLGLNLGYWGAGNDADNIALTKVADELGYTCTWVAEAWGSDAVSALAWIAAQTTSIGIGSAIMQIPARTPAMTAMTAATLDTLSGGRFRLGLGLSGPQVSEGWHGVRFDKPLARQR